METKVVSEERVEAELKFLPAETKKSSAKIRRGSMTGPPRTTVTTHAAASQPSSISGQHFEPLLNDEQAANFLGGLHPKTVQRMARRGELPAYRIGKYWRYRASELNDWLVLRSQSQISPSASTRKESI
jgi:excisionase family DNA binding protein